MSHVDEGTLHAYLDGELAPVERERVDTHLKGCTACQGRLAEERTLLERASRLLGLATPPERAMPPLAQLRQPPLTWRLRRPLAWAATVILAVGLGWFARGSMVQRRASDTGSPEMAPAATPSTRALARRSPAPDSSGFADGPQTHLAMRERRAADSASKDRDQRQLAPAQPAGTTSNALQTRESAAVVTGATAALGASAEQKRDAVAQLPRPTASGVTVRRQAAAAPAAAEPQPAPNIIVDGAPVSDAASGVITRGARRATPIMSTTWPIIARQPARDVLGVEPVVIPGFAVRAYRRNPEAREIVVEQVTDAGTTISLIERRVEGYADELRMDSAAISQPRAMAKTVNERLARFVGLLRIEIDGPLTPDSLSSLLELAR
jgi:putative zinc finger protein